MVAQLCIICNKAVTRTKKGVTCCVCSKLSHTDCGSIDELTVSAIANGSIEWKCVECRKKSTRRSIVNIGDSKLARKSASSAERPFNQKVASSTDSNNTKFGASMNDLLEKISALHRGFDVASSAIEDMRSQMSSIQQISSTLSEHTTLISINQDKIANLEHEVKALNRRLDELEYNTKTPLLQINGIPSVVNEHLQDIIIRIGEAVGVHISLNNLLSVDRLQRRKSSMVATSSDGASDETTSIATSSSTNETSTIPVVVGFRPATLIREFIVAARRKGSLTTSTLGLTSEQDKSSIYVFEHLTASLRKVYLNAKKFQKSNGYKYLWTRDGKIFLRRSDASAIIRVMPHTDLSKIEASIDKNGKNNARSERSGGRQGVSRR